MKTRLLAILTLFPCLSFAADTTTASPSTTTATPHSSIPDPSQELATMTERLKLSPEQQNEIKPILVDEADKKKTILSDTTLTPQQRHDQLGAVHRASLQQIKAYFTPEQMAQIEQGMNHPAPSSTNPVTTTK